jgi:hypothetical protein
MTLEKRKMKAKKEKASQARQVKYYDDVLSYDTYTPEELLNGVMEHMKLKNHAALAKAFQMSPPQVSKIVHRTAPVTARLVLRIHEVTGISVPRLKEMCGLPHYVRL